MTRGRSLAGCGVGKKIGGREVLVELDGRSLRFRRRRRTGGGDIRRANGLMNEEDGKKRFREIGVKLWH